MKLLALTSPLLLAFLSSQPASGAATPLPPSSRDALYGRATNFFPEVALYKPAESDPPSAFLPFAPLILEGLQTNRAPVIPGPRIGMAIMTNGVARVDKARPAVYAAMENVGFGAGITRPAFTYVWCYTEPFVGSSSPPAGRLQGVRVVLDPEGHPTLWQMLADTTGAQLLFVSQSLENAAAARYGKPLQGRRYAIERSLAETPDVVVARVLDDGPVPMGPIVYLQADDTDVMTVICRCMPAQAKRVAAAHLYELLPFAQSEPLLAELRDQVKLKPSFWPAPGSTPTVGSLLRLP